LTKPEFLVAKDEILAALATVPVATNFKPFNNAYNQLLWMDNNLVLAIEMFGHHVRS